MIQPCKTVVMIRGDGKTVYFYFLGVPGVTAQQRGTSKFQSPNVAALVSRSIPRVLRPTDRRKVWYIIANVHDTTVTTVQLLWVVIKPFFCML